MGVLLRRAWSTFTIKSLEEDARTIRGVASTPEPDRVGDVLEPLGASFRLPLPLLWQHKPDQPIGTVTAAEVTPAGIAITAAIAKVGIARIEEAWALIKAGLVRGLSVGFRPTADPELITDGDQVGFKFSAWEWLELSAVTIPANMDAGIVSVKTIRELDGHGLTATGGAPAREHDHSRGVTRASAIRLVESRGAAMKKSLQEQIRDWENTRRTKEDRRDEILEKANGAGELPDDAAAEELETLEGEIKKINAHITRLKGIEAEQAAAAKAVVVTNPSTAAAARDPKIATVQVRSVLPPGAEFVRAVICKLRAFMDQGSTTAVQYAKAWYPDCPRIVEYLERAAVPSAGTVDQAWAGVLAAPTNLASEFLEYLRPATIVGKFGTNGVPALRKVPFNIRITGQNVGGSGYWVGQGAAKPLTKAGFYAQTLLWTKVAAISVLTEELARFSSPAAEPLIREDLRDAIVARMDIDFIDPAKAAVASVSPASITNGVAPLASAGSSADAIRADIATIMNAYIAGNQNVGGLVLIMPETLAMQVGMMRNPLGQKEFDGLSQGGGSLEGIPVITSQYAVHSTNKAMVIAVNARLVLLADDGQVTVDASREASLEMSDAPTGNSVTGAAPTGGLISMFQTNSIALRAERYVNWAKANPAAVVWMDAVTWGAVGGS